MKKYASAKHPDMGFQIAPMIDVVFVIMLFFMVMAGDVKTETELKMKLPGTPGDHPATTQAEEVTVALASDGALSINDSPVAPSALAGEIDLLRQNAERSGGKLLVTLNADEFTAYEKISGVLDSLARARADHVTFAVADVE